MDAVFYLLDAMRLFRGKSLQEIQEITFEIGMLGKYGLDINDPQETHVLRALPGRTFSARELVRFYLPFYLFYFQWRPETVGSMHRTPSGDRRQALQRTARELARDARALQKACPCTRGSPGGREAARRGECGADSCYALPRLSKRK